MRQYIQTVRSRALAGREDEYRAWYVGTHISEVMALGGYTSAEFYSDTAGSTDFLCIYKLETDDLPIMQAAMAAAGPSMTPSEAMDVPATQIEFFEQTST
ncbi:MAG: hypothetical protein WBQ44_05130 [Rhodococcus sp. (in: high G+C Gram-positive bacteria)]